MTSILPTTCSDFELKFDELAERYNFDSPLCDLWDADRCPEPLLIYLAWALSVDNWNEDWGLDVKRQVVKNSLDIHRLKGTTTSLKAAVDALGYGIDLEYWHQNSELAKGTFRANIRASSTEITEETYSEINSVINNNKRGTLHLDSFKIDTLSTADLKCFSYVKIGENIKIYVRTPKPAQATVNLFVGVGVVIRERIKVLTR